MADYRPVIIFIYIAFALLEGLRGGLLQREHTTKKDLWIEGVTLFAMPACIAPTILWIVPWILDSVSPGLHNQWVDWPWWAMGLTILLADDLTQYWWHRITHNVPWLYGFHRAHHSGTYLSIRVVYRNSLPYYMFMPGLWLSAGLIHCGMGAVYFFYIIAKMTVIISAHSSSPWDEPLWKTPATRPIMKALAHIISTPRTHAAHHGRHVEDGVTHYKGNYGNFLFLWDVLFGSAHFNTHRPELYGIEDEAPVSTFRELIWPFGASH